MALSSLEDPLDPLNHWIIVLGQLCSGVWPVVGSILDPLFKYSCVFLWNPVARMQKPIQVMMYHHFLPPFRGIKELLTVTQAEPPPIWHGYVDVCLENWDVAINAWKKRHGEKRQDERSWRDRNEQRNKSENQKGATFAAILGLFLEAFLFMNWE